MDLILEINSLFAEKIIDKKIYKTKINLFKNNAVYNLYSFKTNKIIPLLRTLKIPFKIEKTKLLLIKTNIIKISIKTKTEQYLFNKFLLKLHEEWPFKKIMCIDNMFCGDVEIILNFQYKIL